MQDVVGATGLLREHQRLVQTAGTDRSLDPIVFGILLTTGIAIVLADTGHFNPGRDEFIRRGCRCR